MILLAVALTTWLVLTLPLAVLMGKCISRGLAPAGALAPVATTVQVPSQCGPVEDALAPAQAQPARSRA